MKAVRSSSCRLWNSLVVSSSSCPGFANLAFSSGRQRKGTALHGMRHITTNSWAAEHLQRMGETLEEVPLPPDVILTDEVIKDTPEHVKKLAAELLTLNVLDVNSLCDHLQGRLGLTDSDLFGSLGSGGGGGGGGAGAVEVAEVVEEKTSFDLKLTAFDPKSKIKIIKEVRAVTDLGLKEAKELVESAPCTVKNGLSKEEGEKLLASLTELGATVELA